MQSGDTFVLKLPHILIKHYQGIAAQTERRHKLGKIEAARHKWRDIIGTRPRHSIGTGRMEGKTAVASRFSGALLRACLMVVVVATPSMLLTDVPSDTRQMVALAGLFLGLLTFVEYNTDSPSLIEFRDAPPFNRLRFCMLLATVFALSMMERGLSAPSSLTEFIRAIGHLIGKAMDLPYSPVRLTALMLSERSPDVPYEAVRDAAGVAYFTSLVSLAVFVILMRSGSWPKKGQAFNVWINLPTFDPTTGSDVAARLERDGRINVALGFLLPFVIPFFISLSADGLTEIDLAQPQNLIWTVTAWAFLPASLFMRGIAMGRIADMIRDMLRARDQETDGRMATA